MWLMTIPVTVALDGNSCYQSQEDVSWDRAGGGGWGAYKIRKTSLDHQSHTPRGAELC